MTDRGAAAALTLVNKFVNFKQPAIARVIASGVPPRNGWHGQVSQAGRQAGQALANLTLGAAAFPVLASRASL